jgi:hypothetical protein
MSEDINIPGTWTPEGDFIPDDGSPILEHDPNVERAIVEVNKVIDRMTEPAPVTVIEKTVIDATKGSYTQHPESYTPLRLIVFVQSTGEHYELLRTGEAITRGSTPPPESLECWMVDVPHISWMGVKRAE